MNNDLISRKALLDALEARKITEVFPNWGSENNDVCLEVKLAVRKYSNVIRLAIKDAPVVGTDEGVHGAWNLVKSNACPHEQSVKCSACGCLKVGGFFEGYLWKYCPNCGAKMDGGNE